MERNDSLRSLRWCMVVSISMMMYMQVTARLYAVNQAPEKDPFHQNVPDDQENDSGSSENNEAGDENDSEIVETGFLLRSPSTPMHYILLDVNSWLEHFPKITTPPPRS